ncbi:flagellin N-terminal helical domain-containing protein [Novosphingobium aerophilum]|uniref:Flagellar biosynthesis protein FlgL n=1 Tax=Novosphingobium aerophilum TaxID=2839843 RepID=A0A7X1F870_9SPHN|nr:flagellar biosynthesis protein FlgL [Novosphingobium aerophilum]MBC2652156.1 flagellar biosynthesis protein FlgL [Novosphingobium aerophilum]
MPIVSTSTSAFYDRSTMDIADLRKRAEGLQADLSRGQRISRSSDDPVGASRLRQLQRADSLSQIDVANAAKATADLQLTDGALGSLADYVIRLRELTTQAANGTMTAATRSGIGTEIEAIRNNIIQLANSRDAAGNALFGGQSAGDAYSIDAAGNATYIGTATAGDLPLGDGQNVTRALTGPEVFNFSVNGNPTNLLDALKTLADAFKAGGAGAQQAAQDGLAALNQGLDAVTTAQTVVGSRLSWIDLTTERRTNLGELRANEESDVGGTDIAATVAKLQETMTVLEASQASFTKLASLSLFQLLR